MRDQYAGDVTDLLKFSYMRAVVPPASRLGVAWYYIPTHDGRRDGYHTEYQQETKWSDLDASVHRELAKLGEQRSISALQKLKIWHSKTHFHDDPVAYRRGRASWAQGMVDCLKSCDVIFSDPDNGLSRVGVISRKSATLDEVLNLAHAGRAVILIRFPHRRNTHIEQLEMLHSILADYKPITVRTCVNISTFAGRRFPRIRWFTLINPTAEMKKSVHAFACRLSSIADASATVS